MLFAHYYNVSFLPLSCAIHPTKPVREPHLSHNKTRRRPRASFGFSAWLWSMNAAPAPRPAMSDEATAGQPPGDGGGVRSVTSRSSAAARVIFCTSSPRRELVELEPAPAAVPSFQSPSASISAVRGAIDLQEVPGPPQRLALEKGSKTAARCTLAGPRSEADGRRWRDRELSAVAQPARADARGATPPQRRTVRSLPGRPSRLRSPTPEGVTPQASQLQLNTAAGRAVSSKVGARAPSSRPAPPRPRARGSKISSAEAPRQRGRALWARLLFATTPLE